MLSTPSEIDTMPDQDSMAEATYLHAQAEENNGGNAQENEFAHVQQSQ
jgi:hypothetical protein